ncbi:MAG: DegV family EDD domain-containing protein [Lachnospiraceae bacterium]|nr:DegV family EDD domain-containing protein [Lachnospiraceae bacterium]
MIKIIADSSCNIEDMEGVVFESVPMTIYTEEASFQDDKTLNLRKMLEYFKNYRGRSYTSCPNLAEWMDALEGGDIIYMVTVTSKLSGTYNAAMAAKNMYLQDHPEARIEVFDSKSTGPEMHLIVEKLAELIKEGLDFDEVCHRTHEYMKKTSLYFALGSLHNLVENGRVSKLVASALDVLGMSVIAKASVIGDIKAIARARGEKKIVEKIYEELKKAGYHGGKLRICHVMNESFALKFIQRVKQDFANADIKYYLSKGLCGFYAEQGGILIGAEL